MADQRESSQENLLLDSSRQSCGQANDIHGSADSEVITINPSEMKTHTLEKWLDHLRRNPDLADWVVTKVNHMKNFQYSPVFHEFLKVTVKPTYMSTEEHIIIIERMVDQDQVTFGWQPVDYVLTKWWLVRLLRGHYSGSKHGRLAMISSSTDRPEWRATGYSGSDYLCHLEFNPGIRLMDFTESAQEISNRLGKYDAIKRNCYEFASQLYSRWNPEERGQMMSSKVQHKKGGYYNHKSKFALLPLLGSKSNHFLLQIFDILLPPSPKWGVVLKAASSGDEKGKLFQQGLLRAAEYRKSEGYRSMV